jgi:hypothetical protein
VAAIGYIAMKTTAPGEGATTGVSLFAYQLDDAKQLLASLRNAVSSCGSGYAGGVLKFTQVAPLTGPVAGDESVSYRVIGPGKKDVDWYTVLRIGSTVATFLAAGLPPGEDAVPDVIVHAQMVKLAKVGG